MSKIYLYGLDGLRGIAAMLVFIGHVELMEIVKLELNKAIQKS